MSIKRFQYQIDYYHILSFKEEYKDAVAPYFAFDKVEYGIDNEGSINETIRLVFKAESIAIVLKKDGIVFIFEGESDTLKNQNGPVKLFWDLFERVKNFKNYHRAVRHVLLVHAVSFKTEDEISEMLIKTPYFTCNPFGEMDEFACIYEFTKDDIEYKLQFGNYSSKDIKKHDLRPFQTEFTKDLIDKVGIMGRLEVIELEKSPTFGKFKSLISKAEGTLKELDLL